MLLLALAQGFVRADVAFALHLGILLVYPTPAGRGFALPRRVQGGTSLVAMLLVIGIQYYLMKRVYPHANYGDTPVLQLFLNLRSPLSYAPFLLFTLPMEWTGVMLARRRYQVEPAGVGMFSAAVIFLGMWAAFGRIDEVRIFLPFALAPLTVELAMQLILPVSTDRSEVTAAVRAEAALPHL